MVPIWDFTLTVAGFNSRLVARQPTTGTNGEPTDFSQEMRRQ